jgi:hypothetical protein
MAGWWCSRAQDRCGIATRSSPLLGRQVSEANNAHAVRPMVDGIVAPWISGSAVAQLSKQKERRGPVANPRRLGGVTVRWPCCGDRGQRALATVTEV